MWAHKFALAWIWLCGRIWLQLRWALGQAAYELEGINIGAKNGNTTQIRDIHKLP